jgi:hypothetical protein
VDVNKRAQVPLSDCTAYVEDKLSAWGRVYAIARQIHTVSNRFLHTLWDARKHILYPDLVFTCGAQKPRNGQHLKTGTYVSIPRPFFSRHRPSAFLHSGMTHTNAGNGHRILSTILSLQFGNGLRPSRYDVCLETGNASPIRWNFLLLANA